MEEEKEENVYKEKLDAITSIIDDVMNANFCENDTAKYLRYLDDDIEEIQVSERAHCPLEDYTNNHLYEEICLL